MKELFFTKWESLAATAILTLLAYIGVILLLRLFGKRTLSKMNAFDFIVTVALGSVLATVSLNKSVPLTDGLLAFFLLILMQYIITLLSVKFNFVKKLVTSSPTLLLFKGEMIKENMQKERVTIQEIYMAARQQGFSRLAEIDVMVLEATGSISVIKNAENPSTGTLEDVRSHTKSYAG